jgi:hypothetical protein
MPEAGDRRRGDGADLVRLWDAVARGETDAIAPDVADPADAAAIAWIHALDDAPAPRPAFLAHLEEDLMRAATVPTAPSLVVPPRLAAAPNGATARPLSRRPRPRLEPTRRWLLWQAATAALVLLTLAAGYIAFGPFRPGAEPWIGIPATNGPLVETLADAPLDGLPAGLVAVWVERYRLQPNHPGLSAGAASAPGLLAVIDGAVEVAGASGYQTLTAGEQVVLAAGRAIAFRNAGQGEATLVWISFDSSGSSSSSTFDTAHIDLDELVPTFAADLPNGPTRVHLERLTLPPDTGLPPYPAPALARLGVGEGTLGLALDGPELPARWRAGEEQTFHARPLPVVAAGTTVTLRNAGDGPLVLYRLTMTAVGPDPVAVAAPPA